MISILIILYHHPHVSMAIWNGLGRSLGSHIETSPGPPRWLAPSSGLDLRDAFHTTWVIDGD
jgi:hypothetical protein